MSVAILIPSYGRAKRIPALVENIAAATPEPHTVVVIVESSQYAEYAAIAPAGVIVIRNTRSPNYAGAINCGFQATNEPLLFAGADDLRFHGGWLAPLLSLVEETAVVGTNDLLNPYVAQGLHATHYLFRRDYIANMGGTWEKGAGIVMYEELDHQYTDTAFIGIARARQQFAPCLDSVVEHMHFLAGKAEHDLTYERAYRDEPADRLIYLDKKTQWEHLLSEGVL